MTKSGKHCHYVFNNPSAAETSESVYMRERVKKTITSKVCMWEHFNKL